MNAESAEAMERARRQTDATSQTCQWPGCAEEAPYRAPMSRDRLNQYRWFCLAHVRAYNATWNYYEGMTEIEVEADVRRDTVWQRPTWRLGAALGRHAQRPRIHDGFAWFGDDDAEREAPQHQLKNGQAHAFAILELTPPVTVPILKARYKELVKRHHPDANGGDRAAEERFKEINEAYRTVLQMLQP